MDMFLQLILTVLGTSFVSGLISTLIKDKLNNKYFAFVMQVLNILALNFGKAKNDAKANK